MPSTTVGNSPNFFKLNADIGDSGYYQCHVYGEDEDAIVRSVIFVVNVQMFSDSPLKNIFYVAAGVALLGLVGYVVYKSLGDKKKVVQ